MASGKKNQDGLFRRGRIYYCWIRGKRHSTRCRTRKAAIAVRDKLERAAVDPVYRASYAATVGELCRMTLAEVERRGRSAGTIDYYRSKLGHLVRVLGTDTMLAELTAETVDTYIDTRRSEDAAQHTISKELGALRHVLRVAKRRNAYAGDSDKLFPVGFGGGYDPRRRSLALEEIPALLVELSPRWRAWAAFAIATGARKAEIERAERLDVSPALDVVQVRGTKTDLADDAVAVPRAFAPLLALALELGAEDGPLVGHWSNATRDLEDACTRAGIDRVTPNDLRRTHATLLRQSGASLELVARQLRHSDTRMAARVYARLTADQVGRLLPVGEATVQIRPSDVTVETTGETVTAESSGVSDGNRTRDNWSHKPDSGSEDSASAEKNEGAGNAKGGSRHREPSKFSPPHLRAFRAAAWTFLTRHAAGGLP